MTIPKKLKIGGITYLVTQNKEEKSSFLDRESDVINVNPRLSKTQREIALFHEIVHGINLAFDNEIIIEALASGMHQVLKDNNLLVK